MCLTAGDLYDLLPLLLEHSVQFVYQLWLQDGLLSHIRPQPQLATLSRAPCVELPFMVEHYRVQATTGNLHNLMLFEKF